MVSVYNVAIPNFLACSMAGTHLIQDGMDNCAVILCSFGIALELRAFRHRVYISSF